MKDFSRIYGNFRKMKDGQEKYISNIVQQLARLHRFFLDENLQYNGVHIDSDSLTLFYRVSSPRKFDDIGDSLIRAGIIRFEEVPCARMSTK